MLTFALKNAQREWAQKLKEIYIFRWIRPVVVDVYGQNTEVASLSERVVENQFLNECERRFSKWCIANWLGEFDSSKSDRISRPCEGSQLHLANFTVAENDLSDFSLVDPKFRVHFDSHVIWSLSQRKTAQAASVCASISPFLGSVVVITEHRYSKRSGSSRISPSRISGSLSENESVDATFFGLGCVRLHVNLGCIWLDFIDCRLKVNIAFPKNSYVVRIVQFG